MNFQTMSNLKQRLIVGTFSTVSMLLAIYLSYHDVIKPLFILLITSIIGIALWEFYAIANAKKYHPLRYYGIICSTLYTIASCFFGFPPWNPALQVFLIFFTMVGAFLIFFVKGENPIANMAITLFGFFYVTIPLTFMIQINFFFPLQSLQDGRLWLLYLLLTTKMTDVGAYIFGKRFGRYKITPYISPSKTLEGALGGFLTSVLTSIVFCLVAQYRSLSFSMPLSEGAILGAIIGIAAQFGDLAESLFKRDGKIKDSNQLPGLGGILDVVDSLIFTAPLLYLFLEIYYDHYN